MKWLYSLFMVFLLVLTGQSQTNVISVNVGDYGLVPKATMVTLTLISPNPRTYNNILISQVPISITTSSNGIGYFTNIIWGQYRADINANPVTKFLFVVNTNSTGAISLASLVSNPQALPPNPATNYYTQAQIDALLYGVTSGALTNAYATNAAGIFVTNRVAFISTNYASTSITNGLATTNYVLAQGFVTASVTNGLATTNYVKAATNGLPSGIWTLGTASQSNSTAFAPSSVTNLTGGQIATIAAAITNGQTGANLGYTVFTNSKYQALGSAPDYVYLSAGAGFNTANNFLGNTNYPEAQNTNMGIVFSPVVDNDNYLGATNSLGNIPRFLKFWWRYQDDIRYNTNLAGVPSGVNIFKISKDLTGNGNDYVEAYNDLMVDRDLRVFRSLTASNITVSALTNSGDYYDNNGLIVIGVSTDRSLYDLNGINTVNFNGKTLRRSTGGITMDWENGLLYYNSQSSIEWANRSLDDTNGNPVVYWNNGYLQGNGLGLTNLVTPTNFNNITVTNYSLFKTNAYFAGDIYVTNHAYDVSTSQLDPLANEYVTASFVRSVLNNGAFLYGTTNTISVGFSNILTSSTNKVSLQFGANAPAGYTKGFTNFVTGTYPNGPYFASIVSTNTYQAVTGPFVNDFYIQADGSGAGHALGITPDIFVTYDLTNLIPICAGAEQSLTMAATTNLYTWIQAAAQYNSTNTTGFYIVRRVRVTSQNGTALYINVKGGSGTATTLAFNTPVTVNANYSGTFTGNGSGLTNIPATGITGLGTAAYSNSTAFAPSTVTNLTAGQLATIAAAVTNNASPTLTGLSVGAQTALDVNGNGKVGGVGLTNGVLTGNGSGLTNINSTAVVSTNVVTWIDCSQFINYVYTKYLQADGSLPTPFAATTVYYYPFAQTTYAGPYFRLTPQMTGGYTNIAFTAYLIASNTTYLANMVIEFRANECISTNQQYATPGITIGTLTNGCNSRTGIVKINPSFKGNPYFVSGSINTGGNQFTNTVWLQGFKVEAY